MKIHGLALAALLGAAGTAHAQSAVTLFALIDLNVTQYKAGGKAGGDSLRVMNDGTVNGLNGSRWGVRASEDLGGGLRAGVASAGRRSSRCPPPAGVNCDWAGNTSWKTR